MKTFLGLIFGVLLGVVSSLLLVAYVDNKKVDRESDVTNELALRLINEIDTMYIKKGELETRLEVSNSEVTDLIKMLKNKDAETIATLNNIKVLLLENKYAEVEGILLEKVKGTKSVYFYAVLLNSVKDAQTNYNNMTSIQKEYKEKVEGYNTYKEDYNLYLHNANKKQY